METGIVLARVLETSPDLSVAHVNLAALPPSGLSLDNNLTVSIRQREDTPSRLSAP